MATVKENLIAAKALIDTPEKWIKHDLRNDARTCFCAIGAVEEAGHLYNVHLFGSPEVLALASALERPSKTWASVSYFNDDPDTTHADIMALFDRAIAAEEAKEARA